MTSEMAAACCREAMHATEPDKTLLQTDFELQIDMLKHRVISKKRFLIGLATLYPFLFLVKSHCSIDLITNTLAIEDGIYVCLKGNQ